MARITLDDIIRRAHLAADVPEPSSSRSDAFVGVEEVVDVANAGLGELHDLLVDVYEDWLTKKTDISLVASTETTKLPSDFLKLRMLFILDGGVRSEMDEHCLSDLAGSTRTDTSNRPTYRVMGTNVYWHPLPASAYTAEMWYVRQFDVLEDREDEISPELPRGWEDYVVGHVAEYITDKGERDNPSGAKLKARAAQRITKLARSRNASGPKTVKDTAGRFAKKSRYPYPRA